MTRLMADSVNLDDIPAGRYPLIAYYVDGGFQATPAQLQRHSRAGSRLVPITVGANPQRAVVGDVETGDYTPAEAPDFVLLQRSKGIEPTVYCNASTWPAVRKAFAARGVAEPYYWIAAYPGMGAQIYPGSIAHQYANSLTSGGHFDLSVVADFWPGVDSTAGDPSHSTGDELVTTQAEFDAFVAANPQLGSGGYAARLIFALGATYAPGHPELTTSARLKEILDAVAKVGAPTVTADNSAVLAAIADLKAHPAVLADPVLADKVDALSKHLGQGVA